MSITSFRFFYLLLGVLAVYYVLPRRAQNYWLLVVSYVFYATWAWEFCLTLFVLTVITFFLAQQIQKSGQNRSGLLWLGIGINVAALLVFRTADDLLPALLNVFAGLGIQLSDPALKILLPVGLAFYSLQNISYLVDVHRNQIAPSADFVDFALYLAYFPKLLSGPIERARTFLPDLARSRHVDNELLARSFTLIIVGLIRKMLLAGLLSALIFWDAFETPSKYTGPELICWILIYGLYLYNDFAGYTSIARGVSGLFGLELSKNFKQPFFARSMTEFWNSWHISLSHWLRDYIYFPVSRLLLRHSSNQHNAAYMVLPPMVTMLASGLWHGLGWPTLLWGGLHGFYQVVERFASAGRPILPPQQQPIWRQAVSAGIVFVLVSFAWVPFAIDFPAALGYWSGMFNWTYPVIRYRRILLFVPLLMLILLIDWLERHYQDETFFLRWPRWVQASLLAVSVFFILLLLQSENQQPFVYQGF